MSKVLCIIFFVFTPIFFTNAQMQLKVLIVPGHDAKDYGARYINLKEADMNLALATQLFDILKEEPRMKVYITREKLDYTQEFVDYFAENAKKIASFRENAKAKMKKRIKSGSFIPKKELNHNTATEEGSIILYGINKWANENKIDAVIHVHFNDYRRPNRWFMGKYKGFAIYAPEEQMANSEESEQLAKSIFTELKEKYITSTHPDEKGGLIFGQSLIALGANGTLLPAVRSVLIEYGYIYRFWDSVERRKAYADMAERTADGIKNYFFE